MNYIDFHTHRPAPEGCTALLHGVQTQGIHPWNAQPSDVRFVPAESVWAVGECGLDKLCDTPWEVQLAVFRRHVAVSEQLCVPLLIHCVKALDDIVALRHRMHPAQPWIFHGFRGKPQQLRTLLDAGFYVSFGWHFNEESIQACPSERLLLETDDAPIEIADHYRQVAAIRGISVAELVCQMHANARCLFKSFGG